MLTAQTKTGNFQEHKMNMMKNQVVKRRYQQDKQHKQVNQWY